MPDGLRQVLITGGAGFLGFHLKESFRRHGVAVRIFDLAAQPEWALAPGVEYVQGDIRDERAIGRSMKGVDAVIHAAFASPRMSPETIEGVNLGGAQKACRQALAHGVRRFVLISSTIVQRSARVHPLFRSAGLNALDLYRKSRTEAEHAVTEQGGQRLRVAIVHPKTFLGPGRVSAFTIIFDWIRRGKQVLLLGTAASRYQLLEIRDMAEGIRLLAGSEAEGLFHFGAQEFGTLREDLQSLIEHADTGSTLRFLPARAARAALRGMELAGFVPPSELHYMSAWSRDSVVDTSRAIRELGWQPRWSNAQALANAYDWYRESMLATGTARSIHPLPGSHRMLRNVIEALIR